MAQIMDRYEFKTWENADRVLKDHFELTFGIFRHDVAIQEKRSLASMAVKPAYKTPYDTDTGLFFDDYHEYKVKEYTGMSFPEYVALPYPEFEEVREKCKKLVQKAYEKAEAERVQAEIDARNAKNGTPNGKGPPLLA